MTSDERTRGKFVRFAVALISIVVGSAATASTATLEGRVVDWDSAAPVSAVSVSVRGENVPLERLTESDENGWFAFPLLPAGTYSLTATRTGYSTVTLVGVNVRPGERRSVEVGVSVTDDEEFVTETVSDPLVPRGASVLTVIPEEESVLPLVRRDVSELASLLSGGEAVVARNVPLESIRSASVRSYSYEAEVGRADGGIVELATRSGWSDPRMNVGVRFGDRLSTSETERSVGATRSDDSVARGLLAVGGTSKYLSYYGVIEHVAEDREYVVDSRGIDPARDGRTFDDSRSRTRMFGTLTAQPAESQSLVVGLWANIADGVSGASVLVSPDATEEFDDEALRLWVEHSWQLKQSVANYLEVAFDGSTTRRSSASGEAWMFPSGYRSNGTSNRSTERIERALIVRERFAVLSGRHELRVGFAGRLGREDSVTLDPGTASIWFLGDTQAAATDISSIEGRGRADLTWDETALWLEDVFRAGNKWQVQAGIRVQSWGGYEVDQSESALWKALSAQTLYDEAFLTTFSGDDGQSSLRGSEFDPRVSVVFDPRGDGSTLMRAGFGRFHSAPDVFEDLGPSSMAANGSLGLVYQASDTSGIRQGDGTFWVPGIPLPPAEIGGFVPNHVLSPDIEASETTKVSLGLTRDVGRLFALSIDVAAARHRNLPYALRANPRLDSAGAPQEARRFPAFGDFRVWMFDGEAETVNVTLGGHANVFGKLDTSIFYTWSDSDGNAPLMSGQLVQPDGRMSADATVDPLDPHCDRCFGPLASDPHHRGSLAVRADLPGEWEIGGVVSYRGGLPFTRYDEALADTNKDGFRQDLAPNVGHVNDRRGASSTRLDLRLARVFELSGSQFRLAFDVFNVLDDDAPSGYDRFGEPTAFAGDPSQASGRSLVFDLSFVLE